MSYPDSTLLLRLREHTREAHQGLEARINFVEVISSKAAYVRLLEKFYGIYTPLEAQVAHHSDWETFSFDLRNREKKDWLRRDLRELGLSSPMIDALPRYSPLPPMPFLGQAFGCLYVLEGSTLGGQVISRQIQKNLGMDAANGGAFFAGYGNDTGAMWRAFGETLLRYATTHDEDALILQGATETFAAFDAWFRVDYFP